VLFHCPPVITIQPSITPQQASTSPSLLMHLIHLQVQQGLDLWGLDPSTHTHPLSWQRAADMAVIRPSAAPYSPGMFFQFVLPPIAMARLHASPLLPALLPTARWVGGNAGGDGNNGDS